MESRVQLVAQKSNTNEEKQLELASQVKNHDRGNEERIEDLFSKLNVISQWKSLTIENNSVRFSNFSLVTISINTVFESPKDLRFKVNNLTNKIDVVNVQAKTSKQEQLKIIAQVHGNKQRIESLSSNLAHEIGLLEVETIKNTSNLFLKINSLSSSVTSLSSRMESNFSVTFMKS